MQASSFDEHMPDPHLVYLFSCCLPGAARPIFPFTAIVGQEEMKLSLILNVIDPKIGGVMIMGDRGTGKSTTIRALADLLPEMNVSSIVFMMLLGTALHHLSSWMSEEEPARQTSTSEGWPACAFCHACLHHVSAKVCLKGSQYE